MTEVPDFSATMINNQCVKEKGHDEHDGDEHSKYWNDSPYIEVTVWAHFEEGQEEESKLSEEEKIHECTYCCAEHRICTKVAEHHAAYQKQFVDQEEPNQ